MIFPKTIFLKTDLDLEAWKPRATKLPKVSLSFSYCRKGKFGPFFLSVLNVAAFSRGPLNSFLFRERASAFSKHFLHFLLERVIS